MNYEQKYLKYKAKYIQSKQEGSGLGGSLHIYFISDNDYTTLKGENDTNVVYPGVDMHVKKRDSGLKKRFPHIVQDKTVLYVPKTVTKTKFKLRGKGDTYEDVTIQKTNILGLSGDSNFDYYEKDDVTKVLNTVKGIKKDVTKLLLVRDYGVLHDVFIGVLTIVKDGENVTGLKQEEIPLK